VLHALTRRLVAQLGQVLVAGFAALVDSPPRGSTIDKAGFSPATIDLLDQSNGLAHPRARWMHNKMSSDPYIVRLAGSRTRRPMHMLTSHEPVATAFP
jgi:hypothetical protein